MRFEMIRDKIRGWLEILILGHQKILQYLRDSVRNGTLAHAYLFWGEEHLGKKTVAYEFARMVQCEDQANGYPCLACRQCLDISRNTHPDLMFIAPDESRHITISQIKKLRQTLAFHPYIGKFKFAVIDQAERLNEEASNALLKTLEEPRGDTIIVLVTQSPHILSQTILSRVRQIKFYPVDSKTIYDCILGQEGPKEELIDNLIKVGSGRPGIILDFLHNRSSFLGFKNEVLEMTSLFNKDFHHCHRYLTKNIKSLDEFRNAVQNYLFIFHNIIGMKSSKTGNAAASIFQEEFKKSSDMFSTAKIIEIVKFLFRLNRLLISGNFNYQLAMELLMLKI